MPGQDRVGRTGGAARVGLDAPAIDQRDARLLVLVAVTVQQAQVARGPAEPGRLYENALQVQLADEVPQSDVGGSVHANAGAQGRDPTVVDGDAVAVVEPDAVGAAVAAAGSGTHRSEMIVMGPPTLRRCRMDGHGLFGQ